MSEIGKIIDNVSIHISKNQWDLIDKMLDSIDLSNPTVILLTYVRATFPIRQKLSTWKRAINRIKNEFEQRGLDSEMLLRGLINDT